MLFGEKLRVEEDQRVDDLLGVEQDVEAGGHVVLVPGLHHLPRPQGGGSEVAGGDGGLDLEHQVQQDVEGAGGEEADGQQSLVRPPHWVLHQGGDGGSLLPNTFLHHAHHVRGLGVPEDVRPRPRHLGTLVRSGEDRT